MRVPGWRKWVLGAVLAVVLIIVLLWLTAPEENLLPAVYGVM